MSQFLFLYSFRRPTRGSNIGNKVFNSTRNKRLDSLRHGLVNCYFYRERWLLFHRAKETAPETCTIYYSYRIGGREGWCSRGHPLARSWNRNHVSVPSISLPNYFFANDVNFCTNENGTFRDEKLIQEIR